MASGSAGPGNYAESFYDLKARSFDPRQAAAYHYVIFAHYSSCDSEGHCNTCPEPLNPDGSPKTADRAQLGASGKAEVTGNDFMITLGNFVNEIGNQPSWLNVGGTFMHELGHNLGLSHGGGSLSDGTAESSPNFKPNYLSLQLPVRRNRLGRETGRQHREEPAARLLQPGFAGGRNQSWHFVRRATR